MAKLKLTKNELKKQKDSLKMFNRYLPTLILKKQQLQAEIRIVENRANELLIQKNNMEEAFKKWIAVFSETEVFTPDILKITHIRTKEGNVAGVTIPIFDGADFEISDYDLINTPLWLDLAVNNMKKTLQLDLEAQVLAEEIKLLRKELKTTSQRVNLFEKIKIPECKVNIKKIGVYLGDQQTAAVVRGKIAKKAMEVN